MNDILTLGGVVLFIYRLTSIMVWSRIGIGVGVFVVTQMVFRRSYD